MQIAILDLGTNLFKALIIKVASRDEYKIILDLKLPVNLLRGGKDSKELKPDAFKRGINAIKLLKENIIDLYNVDKTYAFATAGIRNLQNGSFFADYVEEFMGIPIQIITGEQEAEYIYHGVKQAVQLNNNNVLTLDIGGGSCEFLIVNKDKILYKASFKTGASRLMEIFCPSDPIQQSEIEAIEKYLEKKLQPVLDELVSGKHGTVDTLIGSSGSFDSFARMLESDKSNEATKSYGRYSKIAIDEYYVLHNKLLSSTLEKRKYFVGLKLLRVEMIVVSSILVNFMIKRCGITNLIQSSYSMKEGIAWQIIQDQFAE